MKKVIIIIFSIILSILLLLITRADALLASVVPQPVNGNPICENLGYTSGFKIAPVISGQHQNSVGISYHLESVDTESNIDIYGPVFTDVTSNINTVKFSILPYHFYFFICILFIALCKRIRGKAKKRFLC